MWDPQHLAQGRGSIDGTRLYVHSALSTSAGWLREREDTWRSARLVFPIGRSPAPHLCPEPLPRMRGRRGVLLPPASRCRSWSGAEVQAAGTLPPLRAQAQRAFPAPAICPAASLAGMLGLGCRLRPLRAGRARASARPSVGTEMPKKAGGTTKVSGKSVTAGGGRRIESGREAGCDHWVRGPGCPPLGLLPRLRLLTSGLVARTPGRVRVPQRLRPVPSRGAPFCAPPRIGNHTPSVKTTPLPLCGPHAYRPLRRGALTASCRQVPGRIAFLVGAVSTACENSICSFSLAPVPAP